MNRLRDLFTCMLLLGIGAGMGSGTVAAWTSNDKNDNQLKVGTVHLTTDGDGAAVFAASDARPGAVTTKCVISTYSGTLAAQVRMFGTASGPLAEHLDVEVVRGTKPANGGNDCTGFQADTANHAGLGAGVLWRGALNAFPTAATPVIDPQTWTLGDRRAYQFKITMDDTEAAQGLTAALAVTWEAENL
jgi:predicted ribosomally synthesized peptide with SipW-like signal peptide